MPESPHRIKKDNEKNNLLSFISSTEAVVPTSRDTNQIQDNSRLLSPGSSSSRRGDRRSFLGSRCLKRCVQSPCGSSFKSALRAALYLSEQRMVLSWKRLSKVCMRVFIFWLVPPTCTRL